MTKIQPSNLPRLRELARQLELEQDKRKENLVKSQRSTLNIKSARG